MSVFSDQFQATYLALQYQVTLADFCNFSGLPYHLCAFFTKKLLLWIMDPTLFPPGHGVPQMLPCRPDIPTVNCWRPT